MAPCTFGVRWTERRTVNYSSSEEARDYIDRDMEEETL